MLPSHKSIKHVERCMVRVVDGNVSLLRRDGAFERTWSIPHLTPAVLLLGDGCSLSSAAARRLSAGGVLTAHVGGGGLPVFYASLSEYRVTDYLQRWSAMWLGGEAPRLLAAKAAAKQRTRLLRESWLRMGILDPSVDAMIDAFQRGAEASTSVPQLMGHEGSLAKGLYRARASATGDKPFARDRTEAPTKKGAAPTVNRLLSGGNYLAYGAAALVLWVLAIPHGMPVTHEASRRGGLVFDLADLVKDAIILPTAFEAASAGMSSQAARRLMIDRLHVAGAIGSLFEGVNAMLLAGEGKSQ